MSKNRELDPIKGLPPELAELDEELAGILLDERPSFGPELRNQLARKWAEPEPRRRPVWVRDALAASIAVIALTGLTVPPARASLVQGMQRLIETIRGPEDADLPLPVTVAEAEVAGDEIAPAPTRARTFVSAEESTGRGEVFDLPPFQPGTSVNPTLLDRSADRELVRRYYPEELQRAGVGGTVGLLLWVYEDGTVDHVQVNRGSGILALDRAALEAAPHLRFQSAMLNGVPVATWVEFDLVFEPSPWMRAAPETLEMPGIPAVEDWDPPSSWTDAAVVPAPILMESQELLRSAMAERTEVIEERFGPLEGILEGDPPEGANPMRWREDVTRKLEEARVRDPENPAPYLALARIRRKQGLRNDAQMLFEEGSKRAERGTRPVSPRLVAELSYESGRVARENWLAWRDLGEVPATALSGRCPGAAGSTGEIASSETLLAWNYYCPGELSAVLEDSFDLREEATDLERAMLASFVKAVEAYPAHVGANTEILLHLADREEWHELLESARRFGWASQGHPNALLLEGLALQRTGRPEEASERLEAAMNLLEPAVAESFRSVELLVGDARGRDPNAIWRTLDPILSTSVNELQVEHWARAGYAFLRFGSLEADAAKVWMRYGRPQGIRAFGAGPGLRLEFWDYGEGPDVTYYRPAASQNGALTTEADEYLDDLRGVLPHWYGTRARPLYVLPAQLARFRGVRERSTEVHVHFAVPVEFRSEGEGPLQVGVFLVGAGGIPMETLRWEVARLEESVELVAPAGPGVETVVVELYDPSTGMAAGVRAPVEGVREGVSDLLLTRPTDIERSELVRGAEGLQPRASGDRLVGDQVGVFFELYDLRPTDVYRLRVELVSVSTGAVAPLEFRPAGQTLFGAEWARKPSKAGLSPEFVTLDLSGIGPGQYHLRIRAETEDGTVLLGERSGLVRVGDEPAPAPLEFPAEMG